ncbi:MAG: rhomboid family intramembrane serine protease [Bacteroidia bacterium]
MNNFSNEIKSLFGSSVLNALILVNVGVFIFIHLFSTLMFFTTSYSLDQLIRDYLALPASPSTLIKKPWTLITYMFTHEGFFHILFNMLILYWMGRIFIEYLGDKKILGIYILGGLAGALFYLLAYNIIPVFSLHSTEAVVIGASAGVMAVLLATTTLVPEYRMNLLLLGPVPLKYIAAVLIILDLINIKSGNAGGHIAHLGGALFGFLYIKQLRSGRDLVKPFSQILEKNTTKSKMKVVHKKKSTDEDYVTSKIQQQKILDRILDKISESGYESLTEREKEILFRMSKDSK